MFEIGSSLREARERQGRNYSDLENKTKIRTRYLKALEEERFDLLPATAYVRGFIRVYADELGLEGQLYVDEFNSRFSGTEDAGAPFRRRERPARAPAQRSRRVASSAVAVALATIVILLALSFAAFRSNPEDQNVPNLAAGNGANAVMIKLTATKGDSFAEVREGDSHGETLFGGTIVKGHSRTFKAPVWVNVNAVQNLRWTVGTSSALSGGNRVGPVTMLITKNGHKYLSR